MKIFDFIKAANFFPKYAPAVINWSHKMRGKNGRGNDISFSNRDLSHITIGIYKMQKDLEKKICLEIENTQKSDSKKALK